MMADLHFSRFLTKLTSEEWRLILVALVSFLVIYWFLNRKKYNLPPGPIGLPILGYLPFLSSQPHKDFYELSKKYGSVFSLYLGRTFVVILNDCVSHKEVFTKTSTTDRPEKIFDFLPDGIGFNSINGQEWIENRRYCMRAMRDLGLGKSPWEQLVQEEMEDFVKLVAKEGGRPINISPLLTSSVSNNICALIFGKRLPFDDPKRIFLNKSIDTTFLSFTQTAPRNYFPLIIDLLAKLGISEYATTRKKLVEFNQFIRNEVEERRKYALTNVNSDIFIDGYLNEIEKNKKNNLGNTFNDVNLRGNVQALFLGGSDTTRNSLNWLFLTMASFPDIQAKVQKEVDTVVGKDGKLLWVERGKVPYVTAVIMEAQRWQTIVPLNTSRIAMEDIKVCGYDIPKGTTIIANNWALHMDPKYWKDPEKFDPERFLTDGGKQVIYKPESYIPFSFGRRNCPGETVAMIEIFSYFIAFMQNFTILPPEGKKPNMEGMLGLTYLSMEQELRFMPRE